MGGLVGVSVKHFRPARRDGGTDGVEEARLEDVVEEAVGAEDDQIAFADVRLFGVRRFHDGKGKGGLQQTVNEVAASRLLFLSTRRGFGFWSRGEREASLLSARKRCFVVVGKKEGKEECRVNGADWGSGNNSHQQQGSG